MMNRPFDKNIQDRKKSKISMFINRLVEMLPFRGLLDLLSRYATVGAICATVELILFQMLYNMVGLHVMLSNVLAVTIVTVFGFFGQKNFTFRDRERPLRQARLYALMILISYTLDNALVYLFVEILNILPLFAKVLQLGLCFSFNFNYARLVVFHSAATAVSAK
jgi:putative flippase GtrA